MKREAGLLCPTGQALKPLQPWPALPPPTEADLTLLDSERPLRCPSQSHMNDVTMDFSAQ